ncbi:MAG: hypothetical protein CVU97_00725 [Firmicutes bacterium HGW-Firmicutes-21]|nr:MAG: hypothetical protein CVU97_00725 [Firmicutes bacterium HGW-Firmicutes-21]
MNEKLRAYIESLFKDAPKNKKTVELKEEMIQNLIDKYNDLLAEGKSEDAAVNIAIASVGDISDLIEELNKSKTDMRSEELKEKQRRQSAAMIAISIALYIMSVIPLFILQDVNGLIFMFVIVAAATGLIIYSAMTKPKYRKLDDTLVEEFKEWKAATSVSNSTMKAISSAIWMITVAVYFAISFLTSAWYITWIIFLITAAIISIIKAMFDLKK